MEQVNMEIDATQQLSADPVPSARSYQLEALEKALKQNTIVFLETVFGKTMIVIMLPRSYAYLLQKPLPYLAIFLVPQVVLVSQQAEAVRMHTGLQSWYVLGRYGGSTTGIRRPDGEKNNPNTSCWHLTSPRMLLHMKKITM